MNDWPDKPMTCKQAELTMALHIANDPDMPEKRRLAFEQHLENCPKCLKEYQESKYIIELVKQHWQVSEDTLDLIVEAGKSYKPKMTVEEGWKDLCRRCPDLAQSTKKPRNIQLFLRIGAVAACLVIGMLAWMVFTNHSKQQTLSQNNIPQQVATAPGPSLKVEVLEPTDNITIDTSQAIIADNELKTLLINSKHQMIMNVGTVLSIEPTIKHSNIGCLVKLDSGQIHTHVQHDGNPFIVDTANGQAVITGTTFDIKATKDSTTLVVSEGTVRFENENGSVNVKAGQRSILISNSKPTLPAFCNVKILTAWATDHKSVPQLASGNSLEEVFELPSPEGWILKLDRIDYESWAKEKRNWFKREFPEIFELKNCLNNEGIEADYPELLVESGDIWQFNYPDDAQGKIAVFSVQSLEKTATIYGYDKSWLKKNMSKIFLSPTNPKTSQRQTNVPAFENWLKAVSNKSELDNRTVISCWHAAVYLIETRSLIWFAVKNGSYSLTERQQIDLLETIQRQVDAACVSEGLIRKLYKTDPPAQFCSQPEYQQLIDELAENIESTALLEKEILEYEICK